MTMDPKPARARRGPVSSSRGPAIALVLACASGLVGCSGGQARQEAPPPPPVVVVKAARRTVPIIVNPIGTTRALEDVTIRARVKGFLKEKHFQDGGRVEKDQLLLVIDEVPFQLALDQSEAQLDAARAALKKAEASKGPEVAKAQLELDQAQFLLDQVEEHRERALLSRRAASQDDYDRAVAQLKKDQAQVESDRASLQQAEADYRIGLDTARADLARAEAALQDARVNLGYCRMFAPITGRISELKVKIGNLVGDGTATELVNIQQLDPMGVDFRPAARYLPVATALLSQGLKVDLLVEGEREHPHSGHAIFIDNIVDTTTSTFLMRAAVPNPEGSLLPGQYVRARMTVGEYSGAIVVPEQAVVETQEGSRAYVVGPDNKVRLAKVQPVDVHDGLRVLESGLEPGDKVVVEGVQLVRPDQVVAPTEAPLDNFVRVEEAPGAVDQRFNSRISRIPGMAPGAEEKPDAPKPKPTTAPEPKPAHEPQPKPKAATAPEPLSKPAAPTDGKTSAPTENPSR